MNPRVPVRLQPRRPSAHFLKKKANSLRPATSDSDKRSLYGTEENNLRLAHIFFVILVLHLILVIGICLFNYFMRAKKTLKLSVTSHDVTFSYLAPPEGGARGT
ncbi:hypothetical protein AMD24_00352 [Candidatus Xiphinematobacter sp. Idaho Grape]|nr:hypothetical protein AMD24_00352 [Candidatus Xiphinematobacter sp. Idaho Grape]